jgi:hypothetical protein
MPKKSRGYGSSGECLSSKCETLGPNFSTAKKKTKTKNKKNLPHLAGRRKIFKKV